MLEQQKQQNDKNREIKIHNYIINIAYKNLQNLTFSSP